MKRIIGIIRPLFLQPFTLKGSLLSKKRFKTFFLTFSDAFIFILNSHQIYKKEERILVPNFFCIETLNFIGRHLEIVFYKTNDDLSIDKNDYFQQIEKYRPRIILNYAFLGFSLTPEERQRLNSLSDDKTIIIEDCAHRILSDSDISPIHHNHFYIDSIRKHCSLLGSHVINFESQYDTGGVKSIDWCKIKSQFLYLVYQVLVFFSYFFCSVKIFSAAEKIFDSFDLVIDKTSREPLSGSWLSFHIYNLIDFRRIIRHNKSIIMKLNKHLSGLNSQYIETLPAELLENSSLVNYYPVFIKEEIQHKFEECMSKSKIFPWRLWNLIESPYLSQLNKKLYTSFFVFPIHWLISDRELERICSEVGNFFEGQEVLTSTFYN